MLGQNQYWVFLGAKFRLLNEELGIQAASWYDEAQLKDMSDKAKGAGVYMVNYLNDFVQRNDYVNMPKDPDAPAENRGYMTFRNVSGSSVKIPAEWPDATEF